MLVFETDRAASNSLGRTSNQSGRGHVALDGDRHQGRQPLSHNLNVICLGGLKWGKWKNKKERQHRAIR